MKSLNEKIVDFLAQEKPDFFEGLRLYANHPLSKHNLIRNFEQRYNAGIMHEKLIYELEKCIGVEKFSGKRAYLITSMGNVPVKIIKDAEIAAPKSFTYKVKFADLPEKLKKLAIEKGQIYVELDKMKKELALIGKANDDESINQRVSIRNKMQDNADKIKSIHAVLLKYDNSKEIDLSLLEIDTEINDKENENKEIEHENNGDDPEIDNEYKLSEMNWYAKKDLLRRLQSNVAKQKERAESSKKEATRIENKREAEKGERVIAELLKFFDEFPEANI